MARSLVSREQMPQGWLNSDEGEDWFRRRADAFRAMSVRLAESQRSKK